MADFQVITSDFLTVQISTSKNELSFNEKRFPKDLTISELKSKLELITGGSSKSMKIQVFNKDNVFICSLSNDSAMLGSYPIDNGMRLHIVDNFALYDEHDGKVEKFELSEEEYAKKTDSVRSFLLKNKLGSYNEDSLKKKEKREEDDRKIIEATVIGARCKVTVLNAPTRLGMVMYKGLVEGLPGYFIGVKYDEPLGKNNGSYNGKPYFECQPNYGAFVKPQNVLVGDFPEEEYDLNDEI